MTGESPQIKFSVKLNEAPNPWLLRIFLLKERGPQFKNHLPRHWTAHQPSQEKYWIIYLQRQFALGKNFLKKLEGLKKIIKLASINVETRMVLIQV